MAVVAVPSPSPLSSIYWYFYRNISNSLVQAYFRQNTQNHFGRQFFHISPFFRRLCLLFSLCRKTNSRQHKSSDKFFSLNVFFLGRGKAKRSVSPFVCLSICPSIYSLHLSVHLFFHPSICLSIQLSVWRSVMLSMVSIFNRGTVRWEQWRPRLEDRF